MRCKYLFCSMVDYWTARSTYCDGLAYWPCFISLRRWISLIRERDSVFLHADKIMPLNDAFVCFDRYCHSLPMDMTYFDTRRCSRACECLFSVRNVSSKSLRSTPAKKKDVSGSINLLCINLTRLFRVKKLFDFSFPAVLSVSRRNETTLSRSIFQSLRARACDRYIGDSWPSLSLTSSNRPATWNLSNRRSNRDTHHHSRRKESWLIVNEANTASDYTGEMIEGRHDE